MSSAAMTAEFKDCRVVGETKAALRIVIDGVPRWVPKSVIHDDSEVYDGRDNATGKLVIGEWFAIKEGWV